MARRNNAPAISFFSFQDIVTAVTGIMFLIVFLQLLVIFESRAGKMVESPVVDNRGYEAAETPEFVSDHEGLSLKWRLLQKENARLRTELESLPEYVEESPVPNGFRIQLEVPEYIRSDLLLAEISAEKICFREYSSGDGMTFDRVSAFAQWISEQEVAGKHLVLLFKPSGFGLYREVLKALAGIPVRKGIEILPDENAVLVIGEPDHAEQ